MKRTYDLNFLSNNGLLETVILALTEGKSFSLSQRGKIIDGISQDGIDYFSGAREFLGTSTNSVGPYGTDTFRKDSDPDYWEDVPPCQLSIFLDSWYGVMVVYF